MAHILIIDDDSGIRAFLQRVLEMKGFVVSTAVNGREALRVFDNSVDLVITDLLMPHMDGMETIRRLKKHDPALPVIGISGGDSVLPKDYLADASAMGATRTLAKPFTVVALYDAIADCLGKYAPGSEKVSSLSNPSCKSCAMA